MPGHPPLLQELPSAATLPDVPSRAGGCGEAGQGLGGSANRSRWDGNGDEIEWVWVGVRDREEDVKRVEWDRNGLGMKGMGSEWG